MLKLVFLDDGINIGLIFFFFRVMKLIMEKKLLWMKFFYVWFICLFGLGFRVVWMVYMYVSDIGGFVMGNLGFVVWIMVFNDDLEFFLNGFCNGC